jgi:pimeloyl-ACP methyl ester carboxylesterase
VTEFAQDIVMVLEKECLSSLHVIGLSLGGMIAMELAGLMPTQVLSLTIVNSSAAKTHPLRLSPAGMLKLGKMGIQRSPEKRTEVELTALTTLDQSSARYQSVFDSFVTFEKTEPVDAKNVALQLKAAIGFELEPIKKNITMPLLVLYSSKDAFVPNKNSLGLQQQLPHATLRCIEGKGHELMVEDPHGVAYIFDKHATSKQ